MSGMTFDIAIGLVWLAGALGGCKDTDSGGDPSTGGVAGAAGNTGDAGGGAGGASEPSAAAGLNLVIQQSGACPVLPGVPDDVGHPPPDSTSDTGRGQPARDGEAGTVVACIVHPDGSGGFSVQASVTSPSQHITFNLASGSLAPNGAGTAQISLATPAIEAAVASPSDAPCTLSVVAPTPQNMKPGSVWARFDCARLVGNPSPSCGVHGELLFVDCAE